MKDNNCAFCEANDNTEAYGIKIRALNFSTVYLFREQSHLGRVAVACKKHVSDIANLSLRERQTFMEDVVATAKVLQRLFNPTAIDYGAFADASGHLCFHLVPKYAQDPFEWNNGFAVNPQRKFLSDAEYTKLKIKISAALLVGDGRDFRRALDMMRNDVIVDGVIDLEEAALMVEVLSPFVEGDATIAQLVALLKVAIADGTVTGEESNQIIDLLNKVLA